MEEILASIRRIIADEEKPAAKAPPPPEPEPEPEQRVSEDDLDKLFASAGDDGEDDDVLDLTEAEVAPEVDPENDFVEFQGVEPDLEFAEVEPEPEPPPPPPPPKPAPRPAMAAPKPAPAPPPPPAPVMDLPLDEERLVSTTTDFAVSSAFEALSRTVLSKNARTLEDLVQDMLRPMLKTWLDQNLPGMVERMVRAEIERVTRGGR